MFAVAVWGLRYRKFGASPISREHLIYPAETHLSDELQVLQSQNMQLSMLARYGLLVFLFGDSQELLYALKSAALYVPSQRLHFNRMYNFCDGLIRSSLTVWI